MQHGDASRAAHRFRRGVRRQRRGQRRADRHAERHDVVLRDPLAEGEHRGAEYRLAVRERVDALGRDRRARLGQADDDADLASIPERHDRAHARPRALRVRVVDFVCKGAKERERQRDGDEHDE